jgi:hypothetical protein
MAISTLALVLALGQRPQNQYTLGYSADTFILAKGAVKETISTDPPEPKERIVSFRRDKRWAVWDERGLTTRDGDWMASERLEAVPLSPRLFKRAEILATLGKIKAGRRQREASGLSGSKRIGSTVYLLPRWDEDDGTPWLEALVAVDLSQVHPKPKLIGSFGGLSLARTEIDDRLGITDGKLTVAVNRAGTWGVASYDPKTGQFAYKPNGVRLLAFEPDGRMIEKTSYGTVLAGRWDGGRTIPWLETRGTAEFVPGEGPILVRAGDLLRNAVSGAELRLQPDAAVRRGKAGVLVFWPEGSPRSARLYEPNRFEELARWEQGTK